MGNNNKLFFEAISSCLPQFDTTEYDETKYVFEELEQTLKHLMKNKKG